jgi:hypothetical protein
MNVQTLPNKKRIILGLLFKFCFMFGFSILLKIKSKDWSTGHLYRDFLLALFFALATEFFSYFITPLFSKKS